jgi:uncharacterized Zn finger protein
LAENQEYPCPDCHTNNVVFKEFVYEDSQVFKICKCEECGKFYMRVFPIEIKVEEVPKEPQKADDSEKDKLDYPRSF